MGIKPKHISINIRFFLHNLSHHGAGLQEVIGGQQVIHRVQHGIDAAAAPGIVIQHRICRAIAIHIRAAGPDVSEPKVN